MAKKPTFFAILLVIAGILGCSKSSPSALGPASPNQHNSLHDDAESDVESLEFEALVGIAERHGLPMPPRDPAIYSPAYLLKEEPGGSIRILRGVEHETLQARDDREPLWRPFSTDEVEPKLGGHVSHFDETSAFVCALQTAAIGSDETAEAIWRRFATAGWWRDARFGEDIVEQLKDQRQFLGRCIFDHLRNALLKAGVDRKDVQTRMSVLLEEFPNLNTDWRAELFEDLTTTVSATPPQAGSVEALLLDWGACTSTMRHLGLYNDHTRHADAPAREIVLRGYDAIPELGRRVGSPTRPRDYWRPTVVYEASE